MMDKNLYQKLRETLWDWPLLIDKDAKELVAKAVEVHGLTQPQADMRKTAEHLLFHTRDAWGKRTRRKKSPVMAKIRRRACYLWLLGGGTAGAFQRWCQHWLGAGVGNGWARGCRLVVLHGLSYDIVKDWKCDPHLPIAEALPPELQPLAGTFATRKPRKKKAGKRKVRKIKPPPKTVPIFEGADPTPQPPKASTGSDDLREIKALLREQNALLKEAVQILRAQQDNRIWSVLDAGGEVVFRPQD